MPSLLVARILDSSFWCHCRTGRAPLDGAIGSEILPNLNFRFTGWRPQSNLWSLQKMKNILTFDFMYTWNLFLKVGQRQIRIEFKYKKIMKNNTFELFSFPSKKTFLTLCSVMCCAFSFVFGINSTVSWSHHTESLF